jgi:tRNA(fMet)-specific endonuclease VapC
MLDTNAVRALIERRAVELDRWFCEERCSISAIVAAEIHFGLERRRLIPTRQQLVLDLLGVLAIEPFDSVVAAAYGQLRARLELMGVSLAAMDLLIAAHALASSRALISNDPVFKLVPDLQVIPLI